MESPVIIDQDLLIISPKISDPNDLLNNYIIQQGSLPKISDEELNKMITLTKDKVISVGYFKSAIGFLYISMVIASISFITSFVLIFFTDVNQLVIIVIAHLLTIIFCIQLFDQKTSTVAYTKGSGKDQDIWKNNQYSILSAGFVFSTLMNFPLLSISPSVFSLNIKMLIIFLYCLSVFKFLNSYWVIIEVREVILDPTKKDDGKNIAIE